jgi:putative permease
LKKQTIHIARERRWRLAGVLGILLTGITLILSVDGLLVSTLAALVLTYMLNPILFRIERWGINRSFGTTLLFLVAFGLLVIAGLLLTPPLLEQTNSLVSEAPKYIDSIRNFSGKYDKVLSGYLQRYEINVGARVAAFIETSLGSFLEQLPAFAGRAFTVLLLIPFLAFFMLKDGRTVSRQLLSLVPNQFFELALSLSHQINVQIGGFIRARLLEAVIVGAVVYLGLWLVGAPYPAVLAVFAGITNLIPYVGPIVGVVPAIIITASNDWSTLEIAGVGSVYLIAQIIDILFVIPLVVARIVNLHPVTVVIAIVLGSQVLGVLGMLISIPVASVLKLTLTTFYGHMTQYRA